MNTPQARLSERDFNLYYCARLGARPNSQPEKIIGYTIRVHFGKGEEPEYAIGACTDEWVVVDNLFIDTLREVFLIADVFYKIKPTDWVGCHPHRNDSLYGSPRSSLENSHKKIVKKAEEIRSRGSFADHLKQHAILAGVESD